MKKIAHKFYSAAFCMALLLTAGTAEAGITQSGSHKKGAHHGQTLTSGPWFTGPLLTGSPHVIPAGHMNIEPYFYAKQTVGVYDENWNRHPTDKSWTYTAQVPFQMGLIEGVDATVVGEVIHTKAKGKHSTQIGDVSAAFSFQLHQPSAESCFPAIKLVLEETFPVGKFDKLNSDNGGIDGVGSGSYQTTVGLNIGGVCQLDPFHYFDVRFTADATISTNARVKGLNVYGGDSTTDGTVKIGNTYSGSFGLEYSLTQNWALAFDATYSYSERDTFSGTTSNSVGSKIAEQVTVAPAIEYNFNSNIGAIAGVWWTVAGRNTTEFRNYVAAFNFYF